MKKMFAVASLSLALLTTIDLPLRAQEEAVAEPVSNAVGEPNIEAATEVVAEGLSEATAEPTAGATGDSGQRTPTLRPLTVTTGLTDDTRITGTLLDTSSISVKTAFGEASIPLSEVAGLRFPSAEDTSTTIVMLNGDSITGATDVKFISVETSWGNAKINGQSVATMLFVPGLTWHSSEALGGKRWTLIEQKPAAAPAASTPAPRATVGNSQPSLQNTQPFPQAQPQVIFGR